MKIKNGVTRKVFLIGKYAIKIPQTSYYFCHFLQGLLGNMNEASFSKMKDERTCPVIYCSWGGWLLIMPRCKELTEEEFESIDIKHYKPYMPDYEDYDIKDKLIVNVPVEHKICSFGWYNNKIVAIDYGS